MLLIYKLLFLFDIFEHILIFRQRDIIREDFAVFFIEFENSGKSFLSFKLLIKSFKVLRKIIKDKVILENRNNVPIFIIHDITYDFCIIVISRSKVFFL